MENVFLFDDDILQLWNPKNSFGTDFDGFVVDKPIEDYNLKKNCDIATFDLP